MIINSQLGGKKPTGTKQITSNGTHDVTNYASADVQVPTTAPEIYRVFRVNNGTIVNSISTPFLTLPSTATNISDYCYYYAYKGTPASVLSGAIDLSSLTTLSGGNACNSMFSGCTGLTSVDLSSLTIVSGEKVCQNMFNVCTGLTSVDLSSLTTVSASYACSSMFSGCTGLTSVDLSSLTTVSASYACLQMFMNCSRLTSVDLSSLTTLSGGSACNSMFSGCTGLTSVDLSSLTTVSGNYACQYMFSNCTSLTTLSFPALTSNSFGSYTSQFNKMLQGVTGCTVHFPSNLQSVIGSWADVTAGFGGTNTTVLFDLPATN